MLQCIQIEYGFFSFIFASSIWISIDPLIHFKDGALLTLDDAWELFKDHEPNQQSDAKNQLNMLNILTQMEHPVLFKPFLTLHPCRIAEVLTQLPNSKNRVLSFLSIYGPSVFLTLDLDYAKHFNQFENIQETWKSQIKEREAMNGEIIWCFVFFLIGTATQ